MNFACSSPSLIVNCSEWAKHLRWSALDSNTMSSSTASVFSTGNRSSSSSDEPSSLMVGANALTILEALSEIIALTLSTKSKSIKSWCTFVFMFSPVWDPESLLCMNFQFSAIELEVILSHHKIFREKKTRKQYWKLFHDPAHNSFSRLKCYWNLSLTSYKFTIATRLWIRICKNKQ